MDLQLLLAINAMAISALTIGMSLIYRPLGGFGWVIANAIVLIVGALAFLFAPEAIGYWVAAAFIPLVAAPVILGRLSQRQSQFGRMNAAAQYARWASLCHPTEANKVNADLVAALAVSNERDTSAITALAKRVSPAYAPIVKSYEAFTRRDWNEVLAHSEAAPEAQDMLKPLAIRALGETGRTDAMIRAFAQSEQGTGNIHAAVTRLIVMAFGGRIAGVQALLSRPLAKMEPDIKSYWAGVACLNSQDGTDVGKHILENLAASDAKPDLRRAAERQLTRLGTQKTEVLSPVSEATLNLLERRSIALASGDNTALRAYPLTLTLIALNLIMFAAEVISGGSEDSDTLINLGALWPPDVLQGGEWWRLVTASFLHFGPIHIATNMFVLWVLGRLMEPMLGRVRMGVIYAIGGVASSAFVLWLMWTGHTHYGLLVGASGAIFALLGAEAAIILQDWLRDRANFDSRRLTSLAMMLGLQIVIDLSLPNVSFAAHASGFATGLGVMLAWPYVARLVASQIRTPNTHS
jgi:rhomboid protease GluP